MDSLLSYVFGVMLRAALSLKSNFIYPSDNCSDKTHQHSMKYFMFSTVLKNWPLKEKIMVDMTYIWYACAFFNQSYASCCNGSMKCGGEIRHRQNNSLRRILLNLLCLTQLQTMLLMHSIMREFPCY